MAVHVCIGSHNAIGSRSSPQWDRGGIDVGDRLTVNKDNLRIKRGDAFADLVGEIRRIGEEEWAVKA